MKKSLLIPFLASTMFFYSCKTQKNLSSNKNILNKETKVEDSKKHLEEVIKNFNGKDTIIFKNYFYNIELCKDSKTGKKSIWKNEEANVRFTELTEEQIKKIPQFDYESAQKIINKYNILETVPNSLDSLVKKMMSNEVLFSYNIKKFYTIKIEEYLEKSEYDKATNYLKKTEDVIKNFVPKNKEEKILLKNYYSYLKEKEEEINSMQQKKYEQKNGIYKSYNLKGYPVIVVVSKKYFSSKTTNFGKQYEAIVETDKALVNYVRKNYGIPVKKVVQYGKPNIKILDETYNKAITGYTLVKNKKLTRKILKDLEIYKPYKE